MMTSNSKAMTTIAMTTSECPALNDLADFLTDYASALLSSGCTTLRIDKNIHRMSSHYGVECVMTVMPRHLEIMLHHHNEVATRMAYWRRGVNFHAITALSHLSWKVVEDNLTVENAMRCVADIRARKRLPVWKVTLMAAVANASFCRLFNGDYWAMLFVFAATAGGFYAKHRLTIHHLDPRLATIAAACLSAIIACGTSIYHLGNTPETAVATSVLYLVPGIPFINAFSDFLNAHYICSMSWMMSALETTACLASGLVLANYLLKLF